VPVPDVTGQTAAEATDTLEAEGFSVTESEEASADVDAGEVIRTEPAAGTEVEEGSTVEIVVSTGAETVAVPDVVGKTAAEAEVEIQDAGLRISTSQEPSDDVELGLVIRTDPEAGTEVELGATVAVVVSSGAEPIVVPDVTGRTESDARAELEDLGLVVEVRTESSEDVDEGLVVSTDPAAGATVEAGTTVTMTVSSGPEPQPDEARVALAMSSSGVLTVSGVNFLPDSIVESLVVGTNISSTERVDADGLWQTELDMSSLVSGATYQLLVTGTDAQGNRFEDLLLIPTFGGEEDDSISPWIWVIGLALLAGVIALLLWLVSRNQDSEEPGGGGGTITAASGTAVAADDVGADTIVMDELPDEDPGDPGAGGDGG
jgi:beta-lactam-binding protein with PASTA domain